LKGPDIAGDAARLGAKIGHRFDNLERLETALTHPSASTRARPDYQRLEFLGDRVLGLVIAEMLLARFPKEAEGRLAPRLNALVRKETCADVASEIGLGDYLRLGRSESTTGGRRKTAILGDAMEALIATVYLDGGYEAARAVILRLWDSRISEAKDLESDPKTALQEWAQARGLAPPAYETVDRSGPDHAPMFTIAARLETGATATAEAASKRAAQQAAAAALLEIVENG
jgi:ribonuclease-3